MILRYASNCVTTQDSEVYIFLLHQIAPEICDLSGLQEPDLKKRAAIVVQNADKVGCGEFISVESIIGVIIPIFILSTL